MPKLPRNLKPQKLVQMLQKQGFEVVGKRGSHVRLKHKGRRFKVERQTCASCYN